MAATYDLPQQQQVYHISYPVDNRLFFSLSVTIIKITLTLILINYLKNLCERFYPWHNPSTNLHSYWIWYIQIGKLKPFLTWSMMISWQAMWLNLKSNIIWKKPRHKGLDQWVNQMVVFGLYPILIWITVQLLSRVLNHCFIGSLFEVRFWFNAFPPSCVVHCKLLITYNFCI